MLKGFSDFLKEYKILSLAIAFIMGVATNTVVQSLVNNVIMPIIQPLIPSGNWEDAAFSIGPISIKWGAFLSDLLKFLILALVVYIIAKKVLKEEKVGKK